MTTPKTAAPLPLDDLPLYWEGRARAFRIIDNQRIESNEATLAQAGVYEECANELRASLRAAPAQCDVQSDAVRKAAVAVVAAVRRTEDHTEWFEPLANLMTALALPSAERGSK